LGRRRTPDLLAQCDARKAVAPMPLRRNLCGKSSARDEARRPLFFASIRYSACCRSAPLSARGERGVRVRNCPPCFPWPRRSGSRAPAWRRREVILELPHLAGNRMTRIRPFSCASTAFGESAPATWILINSPFWRSLIRCGPSFMGSGSAFCTAPLHEPHTRAVIAMTGARALPRLYWSMAPFGPTADQMGSFRYFGWRYH
jgi:hypothetical protein